MKSNLKKYLPYIITYFVIFIILFIQHSVIHMYFDDFGNASLSYSNTVENVIGTNYTFKQLFDEAIYTYFNFGGRILYGMIVTLLLKNGIKPFMILQVFVILGIFYMISSIVTKITKKKSVMYPIICMILYMLFNITLLKNGIYWASASILYLWPMLPFFTLINYYLKITDQVKHNKNINYLKFVIISFILMVLSVFSQEQIGIGLIIFFIVYIFFDHIKDIKKYLKYDLFLLIVGIITYLFLFLAPGNWVRMSVKNNYYYNLSFFEKIMLNIHKVFNLLFATNANVFINIIVSLAIIYIFYTFLKNYKKSKKYYLLLILIFNMLFTFIIYYFKYYNYPKRLTFIGGIILLSLFISLFIYYKDKKGLKYLSFPIGAACTVFCLLMSPYMLERCVIPCILIMFIPIISIGYDMFISCKAFKVIILILISICLFSGVTNYTKIYLGYRANDKTNSSNYYKLQHYKKYVHNNELKLCKVKNRNYGSTQPYEINYDYWLEQYFDLPWDLNMKWVDCNEKD